MPPSQSAKSSSTQKNTKQPQSPTITSENWQAILTQLNFNDVCTYLQCQVALVAEKNSEHSDIIDDFYTECTSEPKSKNVACVEFNDIIFNMRNEDCVYSTSAILNGIYTHIAKEALNPDSCDSLSGSLLAKLVKVRILMAAQEMEEADQLEELGRQPTLYQPRCVSKRVETSKTKPKAGKGKDNKSKNKAKKGKNKVKESKDIDLCDPKFAYVYSDKMQPEVPPLLYKHLKIPDRRIYIVLLGFYDLSLFDELLKLGIRIVCFVQVHQPQLLDSKLSNFWIQLDQRFKDNATEESFLVTIPIPTEIDGDNSAFEHIESVICKIYDIQKQHTNYNRNLRIDGVSNYGWLDNKLHVFNSSVKKFPLDTLTVPILLHLLSFEISSQVLAETKEVEASSHGDSRCSGIGKGPTEKLIELFDFYINPIKDLKGHSKTANSKTNISYTSHERNMIRIISNAYGRLSENFFDMNMDILKSCSPKIIFQCCNKDKNDAILRHKHNNFGITKDEVLHLIFIIILNSTNCKTKEKSEKSKIYPWLPKFPTTDDTKKDDASQLTATKHELELWYENLNPTTMLQELANAEQHFSCVHKRYLPDRDVLLLDYHQHADDFGYNQVIWSECVRTPVCLRDFCKFIVHEQHEWLSQQTSKFDKDREQLIRKLQQEYEQEREKYYPTIKLTAYDLIQCGSIKERVLQEPQIPQPPTITKVGKGKNKNKKIGKDKGGKGSKKSVSPRTKVTLPPLPIKKPELPLTPKLSPRGAKPGEEYSFEAYDLGYNYVSLEGFTKTFYSRDGVTVTIEKDVICSKARSHRVNVSAGGNTFVFNYGNENGVPGKQLFHIALSNGGIICFQRRRNVVDTFPKFKPLSVKRGKLKDQESLKRKTVATSGEVRQDENGNYMQKNTFIAGEFSKLHSLAVHKLWSQTGRCRINLAN